MFNVLHYDESELIKKMVKDTLRRANVDYIPVSVLSDAYKIINSTKLDLIVTSMIIEGSTIENLLKRINTSMNRNTPVFIITGSEINEGIKKVLNLGVSDYITKENLTAEISKYVDILIYQENVLNSLKNISIAVVDDNSLDQAVVKDILTREGINDVDFFDSGKDLLKNEKQYDLYIIDAVLKDEYGKGLVMQIRRKDFYATIIIISSLNNPKTLVSLLNSGANDFIQKPLNEGFFIAKLKCNMRAKVYADMLKNV